MKRNLKRWLIPTGFALGGACIGYLYYYFFGCSGNCAITSNPMMTMIYTGIIGLLISGVVQKDTKKEETA